MQGKTLLVAESNNTKRDEAITKLLTNHTIDIFDTTILEENGSIGIAQIRLLQKNIYLKSLKGTIKACIVKNAETLTIEAQNAMLKILEEPPDNTIIVLAVKTKELLLPTILSRCSIIEFKNATPPNPIQSHKSSADILVYLQSFSIGNKLKQAQDLAKNKDETITWLENTILTTREQLINSILRVEVALGDRNRELNNTTIEQLNNVLQSFQKTYVTLKTTNTNLRLTLETLFLTL